MNCPKCGEQTIRGHRLNFADGESLFVCSIVNAYGERDEDGTPIGLASKDSGDVAKLLGRAIDAMAALHRSVEPMEDDPELAGRVPPAAFRAFVDELAAIDREAFAHKPKEPLR